ncbi:MAG: GntR family transcriptional regulator [Pirellula sp.]
MFFSIDPNNGLAIYDQIVRQVKFAIAEGTLLPGQLLPSVRVLSQRLAINPNTLARAFLQLQSDGALESLRGRGLVVCANAAESCKAARRNIIEERIRGVLSEALHSGLSAKELRKIVLQQIELLDGNVATVSSSDSNSTEQVES